MQVRQHSKMRQPFANISMFSEPALFVGRAYKVKAGKKKADH